MSLNVVVGVLGSARMRRPLHARTIGAAAALAICGAVAPAAGSPPGAKPDADSQKAACVTAYEKAQTERADRHFKVARAELVACTTSCPATIQAQCVGWLGEVDKAMPSVVVRARLDGGQDTADVRVLVDGEEVAKRVDGGALLVDPGERHFRFEHAGLPPVEQTLVIGEGEQLRPIAIEFTSGPSATARPAWPMYALGGLGGVGIGLFAVLGITGVSRYSELKNSCSPNCDPSDTSAVKTRFLVADISLGVGIVALGGAAYLYFTRPHAKAAPPPSSSSWKPELAAMPTPGGAFATARFAF